MRIIPINLDDLVIQKKALLKLIHVLAILIFAIRVCVPLRRIVAVVAHESVL